MWFVWYQIVALVIDVIRLRSQSDADKDFEILVLRRELAILRRHQHGIIRPERADKLFLTALLMHLKTRAGYQVKQLGKLLWIVQPQTVLGWHRDLVRPCTFCRLHCQPQSKLGDTTSPATDVDS